jgi:hypothetical protein
MGKAVSHLLPSGIRDFQIASRLRNARGPDQYAWLVREPASGIGRQRLGFRVAAQGAQCLHATIIAGREIGKVLPDEDPALVRFRPGVCSRRYPCVLGEQHCLIGKALQRCPRLSFGRIQLLRLAQDCDIAKVRPHILREAVMDFPPSNDSSRAVAPKLRRPGMFDVHIGAIRKPPAGLGQQLFSVIKASQARQSCCRPPKRRRRLGVGLTKGGPCPYRLLRVATGHRQCG